MKQPKFFLSQNEAKYLLNLMKKEDYLNTGKHVTFAKLEIIADTWREKL